MEMIRDGKGRGYLASINSDNQMVTRATAIEQRLHSTIDEFYYEATTGVVTLTDANETGIIYLKNDNTQGLVMVIDRFFFDIWASTSGTGGGTLKYYRNPTITGGTDIVPNNTNYGSVKTATGTFKKSTTTMTAGTVWWTSYITASCSIALEEGRIVLPAGSSHGVSVAAPTGNTSMALSMNVAFYFFDSNLI